MGTITVLYAYAAPNRDLLADYRGDDPAARALSGLPEGLVGAVNSPEVDHSRALSIEVVVRAGQPRLAVTISTAGSLGPVTDDQMQALALEIMTTVPPPT